MEPPSSSRIYTVLFFIAAAFTVSFICLRVLRPFLAAIAWAVVLAVAFQTPWRFLERRLPKRPSLAAGLVTIAIALLVILPAGLFVGVLVSQTIDLAAAVAQKLQDQHVSSLSDLVALPVVAGLLDRVQELAGITPENLQKMSQGFATRASTLLASVSGRLVLGAFDVLLTFVTTIFLLFFFFRDGDRMSEAAIQLVPSDAEGRAGLRRSFKVMVEAIFRGSLLCSLVQGLTGAIGWWIAGLPSPMLAGAAMAVLSLVPLGGTALVWIPGTLWSWYGGHHGSAIFLFLWCAIVTSFAADNLLRPVLIRGSQELSTIVVFLGVFGGLAAFGILGIFIGPVALAMAASLLEVMRAQARTMPPGAAG